MISSCLKSTDYITYILYDPSLYLFSRVSGIRGLTQECLIALSVDVETRNFRQEFNSTHNIPLDHPRSSKTDDVECFFSVLQDVVEKDFTLKQVR